MTGPGMRRQASPISSRLRSGLNQIASTPPSFTYAILNRIFEAAALGADRVTACTDNEVRVQLFLRRNRGFVLADRFLDGDEPPPRQRTGLFRCSWSSICNP